MAVKNTLTQSDIKKEIGACEKLNSGTQILDLELTSLEDLRITTSMAKKLWKADTRYISDCFLSFIRFNHKSLKFLGVDYEISTVSKTLLLKPSLQIGCAPLISPQTGKPCGNIVVKSRFNDDIAGVMPLIGSKAEIKYEPLLKLNSSPLAKPPVFLECLRYIDLVIDVQKKHWQKFANYSKIETQPSSSTNWCKYAVNSYDPANSLKYPNRVNRLITDHLEWRMLMYVLSISIKEIESLSTPQKIKQEYYQRISQLKRVIQGINCPVVREIRKHAADPVAVKELKDVANIILKNQTTQACAWTLDISKFFERFVQFVFGQYARRYGGIVYSNQKFGIRGNKPEWGLDYIEPDVILAFSNKAIVVDAKYKRHMTNLRRKSKLLKDEFRKDFHQVLAYSSLLPQHRKSVVLCYPTYDGIKHINMNVQNPINGTWTNVDIIGGPLSKDALEDYLLLLKNVIKQ